MTVCNDCQQMNSSSCLICEEPITPENTTTRFSGDSLASSTGWAALAEYIRREIDEARSMRDQADTEGHQRVANYWDGKVSALDELWNVFAATPQAPAPPSVRSIERVDALTTALRQWKHYAEEYGGEDRDIETDQDLEADLYRCCKAALSSASRWR